MITIFIYISQYILVLDNYLFLTFYAHRANFYGFLFDLIVHLYHICYMPLSIVVKAFFYAYFNPIGCIMVYLNSIYPILGAL